MKVARRDQILGEAIETIDARLDQARGEVAIAYQLLSTTEQDFIMEETARCLDFRYYAENYHVILSEAEGLKTLYPFWDSQEIFYRHVTQLQLASLPVKLICLKARQLGLSTISQALIFHGTIFTPGCNTLVVAQDPSQADYLFSMSRLAYDSLPWWLRPEKRYEAKGRYLTFDRNDDNERLLRPGLRSQIFVEAANKMTGVSVGKTMRRGHLSELSLWEGAEILAEQILPAMNAPDELAIMESTARGRGNFWHKFWVAATEGKVDWTPVFIESFRVKKYSLPIPAGEDFTLTENEMKLREKVKNDTNIEITNEHLHWRRKKMDEFIALQGDPWKFYQEYPAATWYEAFQGSGICAFNKIRLQAILESDCVDPIHYGEIRLDFDGKHYFPHLTLRKSEEEKKLGNPVPPPIQYGARLYIWEMPSADENYYIAADVAHGVQGGAFSCAQVVKIGKRGEKDFQVAEWHGWENPTPFGSILVALGYYYNTAQIAVECNDVGLTTNNHLFRTLEYPNVFRWKHYDKVKNFMTDFFGWFTTHKTRGRIISKFREALDQKTFVIRSGLLVDECLDFGATEEGERFEGQSSNDDRVMAAMIANFCAHDSDWGVEVSSEPRENINTTVDFINTEFSPLHDRPGFRKRMHDREVPAEVIMYTDQEAGGAGFDDQWKLY